MLKIWRLIAIFIFALSLNSSILANPTIDQRKLKLIEFDEKLGVAEFSPFVGLYYQRLKKLPPSKASDLSVWVSAKLGRTWKYQQVPWIEAALLSPAENSNAEGFVDNIKLQDQAKRVVRNFSFDEIKQSNSYVVGVLLSNDLKKDLKIASWVSCLTLKLKKEGKILKQNSKSACWIVCRRRNHESLGFE